MDSSVNSLKGGGADIPVLCTLVWGGDPQAGMSPQDADRNGKPGLESKPPEEQAREGSGPLYTGEEGAKRVRRWPPSSAQRAATHVQGGARPPCCGPKGHSEKGTPNAFQLYTHTEGER